MSSTNKLSVAKEALRVRTNVLKGSLKSGDSKITFTIKDMPQPRSLPMFGTKLNFLFTGTGSHLHDYVHQRHMKLGPIFRESLGGSTELVFVSDPRLLKSLFLNLEGKYPAHILPEPWILYEKLYGSKRGLFFMNGEEWLDNRRKVNKHLLCEDADKWLESPVKETTENFIMQWKSKASEGKFIPDLETDLYRLSLDVTKKSSGIFKVLVQVLLGSERNFPKSIHHEEILQLFAETVKTIFQTTTKLYGFPIAVYQRLNMKAWRDFKESVDKSLLLGQKIVNEIQNLNYKSNGLITKLRDEKMSNESITRIVTDLIIAAGDTTAYTTLWTLYLLSKSRAVIEETLSNEGSNIKHVVKESMRLYPVAPFLTRILPRDCYLGQYKISQGTPIIASVYTSGRDDKYFSKAEEFLPYRWDRNDVRRQGLANHNPSASLPFALGARSCVGKKIAMMQLTQTISQIVKNFDFTCENALEVKPTFSQVLVPNQDIKLSISVRN